MILDVAVGGDEKAARARCRVLHDLPACGFIRRMMQSIRGRGVKYCPAPDFLSSAFFSAGPHRDCPGLPRRAENQSSWSIFDVSVFEVGRLAQPRLRVGEDGADHPWYRRYRDRAAGAYSSQ